MQARPMKGEDRLIHWLRARLRTGGRDPLGDDAAILDGQGELALTVDQQIEGVHFPAGLDPKIVAHRLLAVNLSDLASMGAAPEFALLALTLPQDFDPRPLFRSLLSACKRYDLELVGGDLARGPRLAASLTLAGRLAPESRWLRRSLARPDDILWVGGTLGESVAGRVLLEMGASVSGRRIDLPREFLSPALAAAGRRAVRRHLRPTPQLELGQWLSRQNRAAAIDISDGFSLDLSRLCEASACGAEVDVPALPKPPRFTALCSNLGRSAEELQLSGGEDYVLLFSLSKGLEPPARFRCRPVGRVLSGRNIWATDGARRRPLEVTGWDHLRASHVRP